MHTCLQPGTLYEGPIFPSRTLQVALHDPITLLRFRETHQYCVFQPFHSSELSHQGQQSDWYFLPGYGLGLVPSKVVNTIMNDTRPSCPFCVPFFARPFCPFCMPFLPFLTCPTPLCFSPWMGPILTYMKYTDECPPMTSLG